jgi:hypothetical protein
VSGIVYFDVDPRDLVALDVFEGSDYERQTVEVRLAGVDTAPAETYFYLAKTRLLESPWEPDAFQMQRFLDTYCRSRLGN